LLCHPVRPACVGPAPVDYLCGSEDRGLLIHLDANERLDEEAAVRIGHGLAREVMR